MSAMSEEDYAILSREKAKPPSQIPHSSSKDNALFISINDIQQPSHCFQGKSVESLRILVVNDEQMALLILSTILTQSIGVQQSNIQLANNGKEALEKAENQYFDLIFMDLNMPVMGGFESTQKIKSHFPNNPPYIVALSASTIDESMINNCKNAGFDDQFQVPISA